MKKALFVIGCFVAALCSIFNRESATLHPKTQTASGATAIDNAVEFVAHNESAPVAQEFVWVTEAGGTVTEMKVTTNKFAPDQKSEAEVRALIEVAKNKKR